MNDSQTIANDDTLPKLLLKNFREYGSHQVAIREKDFGIWQSYSWADYYNLVKHLCLSFIKMGLKPGDRVSILGENKPHIYWFELAVHAAGGVVVGIFADCTPPEVEHYVGHSESRFVVCQDQEQVDKLIEIKDKVSLVEKVIYWDTKGLWRYTDPLLMSMGQMIEIGKEEDKKHPNLFEESVGKTQGEDVAVFFYTSGTTGQPKAGMITHRSLLGMAAALHEVDRYKTKEEYLSFLPIAWLVEQIMGVACSLIYGLRVNFPEKPETVQQNIREMGPQVVFFGPRLWENLIREIQVSILDSSWLHQRLYNLALKIGYRMADIRMRGRKAGLSLSVLFLFAHFFVFRPLHDNLGLSKTRVGYSAGSALGPEVIRYLHAIGINVKQLYGSSEVGVVTCHRDNDIKAETCGLALHDVDIKISEEGEIIVRTPNMFVGYYKNEEMTRAKLKDGWYRTEDFGFVDKDDHLVVMDRMEDLLNLAGGQKFSPQFCEIRLRFSPYIKDVLVVARETEEFAGALINIDLNNVGHWAESKKLPYTTFTDLSQKAQVIKLIQEEIAKVNTILPDFSNIRKFINLHKEFDPDEAEMTRTRKLRRTFVEERFKQMIDAIFGQTNEIEVVSQITYRDGRTGTTTSLIKVNEV